MKKTYFSSISVKFLVAIADYLVNATELEYLLWNEEILFSTIYRRKF